MSFPNTSCIQCPQCGKETFTVNDENALSYVCLWCSYKEDIPILRKCPKCQSVNLEWDMEDGQWGYICKDCDYEYNETRITIALDWGICPICLQEMNEKFNIAYRISDTLNKIETITTCVDCALAVKMKIDSISSVVSIKKESMGMY